MLIYKVENLINGSCYIGQTVKSLEKRKLQHLCDVRNDSSYYLHRAIRKYGNENFKWSILCECLSKDDLNEREIYYIKELNTQRPNGYNLTLGGEGNLGWCPTEDTRKNISESNKNYWLNVSDEYREEWGKRISVLNSGENNPMYGKIRVDMLGDKNPAKRLDVRKKISEKRKCVVNYNFSEYNKSNKDKSFEDRFGKERADSIKEKMSKNHIGVKKSVPVTDEQKEKQREKMVKNMYKFISPEGTEYITNSLRKFCVDNNLNRSTVSYNLKRNKKYNGWSIEIINEIATGFTKQAYLESI